MSPLHAVPAAIMIPLDVDRLQVVSHARRVQELTVAWGEAVLPLRERARAAMGPLLPIGVALSWALDLRAFGKPLEVGMSTDEVRAAAFPSSPKTKAFREAFAEDATRYDPPDTFNGTCPVAGPRGGKCNEPRRQHARWVTDLETGAWQWRDICATHQEIAQQRANTSPDPAPNRGGVLERVFPEINMHVIYQWARPHWTPPGEPAPVEDVPITRRSFRLVIGGAS